MNGYRRTPYYDILNPALSQEEALTPQAYQGLPQRGGGLPSLIPQPGGGLSIPPGEQFQPASAPAPAPYQEGGFYKLPTESTVYKYTGGELTPYTLPAFQWEGAPWQNIQTVPSLGGAKISPWVSGGFYKKPEEPTVYLSKEGKFIPLSLEQFQSLGAPWGEIKTVPTVPYKTPTEEAYGKYKEEIGKGIPLIQQRYGRLLEEIGGTEERGRETLGREQERMLGQTRALMAQRRIVGSSMEYGEQAKLGEAYGKGIFELGRQATEARGATTEESVQREQAIRELMAKSTISEQDTLTAKQIADREFGLQGKQFTEGQRARAWQEAMEERKLNLERELEMAKLIYLGQAR